MKESLFVVKDMQPFKCSRRAPSVSGLVQTGLSKPWVRYKPQRQRYANTTTSSTAEALLEIK